MDSSRAAAATITSELGNAILEGSESQESGMRLVRRVPSSGEAVTEPRDVEGRWEKIDGLGATAALPPPPPDFCGCEGAAGAGEAASSGFVA